MKKKIKKILGYIVVSDYPARSGVFKEAYGTLWFGGGATLFSSRNEARKSLRRTKRYAKKENLSWPWLDQSIILSVIRRNK